MERLVKAFNGKIIDIGDCMGCTKAANLGNANINPGGIIQTKNFDISQDFELPINGFIVIGSLRHVGSINEMTQAEKQELITLIDVVIASLKKLKVCQQYNVIWEEKDGNHFHVWLMPRHQYLRDAVGRNIVKKIGDTFDYAKTNLETKKNLTEISNTIEKLKIELQANEIIQKLM